ncbi:FAD binding domain-containing protein [Halenospora varia]|nr:FAD binding domain-containing protein [Halenospora varia]
MSEENKTEVFIVGSGSAGICAALWLSILKVPYKIVDARSGPLKVGQADGVQCRTVEIFESFNLSEELLREAYHVSEVAFWEELGEGKGIKRKRVAPDTVEGLSHCPHVILNQARINGLLLGKMRDFGGSEVGYGYKVLGVDIDEKSVDDPEAYCVSVRVEKDGKEVVYKAKYVLGCDGAHSAVRKSLGFKMLGDTSDSVWGVMDIYPLTTFPDIRKKVVLQSSQGSLLIIPREGDSLVRFYIELPCGTIAKDVTLEQLHVAAREIFKPYEMEFAGTYWWSAYSIGQRLADHFSKDNRVFLTGDACHTHSPKAGQGMNVSLQDGYNMGWKLASILKGKATPELLRTYNIEREKVAATLIDFDRTWAKQMSSKSRKGPYGVHSGDEEDFSETFVKAGRYTAGLTATYDDSMLTNARDSGQTLAPGLRVGMRFPSAQVVRFSDAKAMQLVKAFPSDGRWRILVFAGDIREENSLGRLQKLGDFLFSNQGPIRKFTSPESDIDSFLEVIVVLSGERTAIEAEQVPDCFRPVTGKWRMKDIHKVFVDDESYIHGHGEAYKTYEIDSKKGAMVIVRPDQYVAMVVDVENHESIDHFFAGCTLPQK